MIEVLGLHKTFGTKEAVHDLTLRIAPGEVYAFLGPNGAGKTTTIKCIAGLLLPTAGRVLVSGRDMATDPIEAKRRLAYVPDTPFLYERLSGREFLSFVGAMHGMNPAALDTEICRWEKTFEMASWLDRLAKEYSHGMRQRVVLASALLHRPDALVIDEPMVALDPKSARLLKQIFRQEAERRASVFVSTHDLAVAEEIADRIGIIREGRLIAEATVSDLRARFPGQTMEDIFLNLTG